MVYCHIHLNKAGKTYFISHYFTLPLIFVALCPGSVFEKFVGAEDDPCVTASYDLFSSTFKVTRPSVLLRCFRNIPYDPVVGKSTVETMRQSFTNFYATEGIIKRTPDRRLDVHVDIQARLDEIERTNFSSEYDFHFALRKLVFDIRDAHVAYFIRCFLIYPNPRTAFPLTSVRGERGEPEIRIADMVGLSSGPFYYAAVPATEALLNITVNDYAHAKVLSIDGLSPYKFLDNYANNVLGSYRDPHVRFNFMVLRNRVRSSSVSFNIGQFATTNYIPERDNVTLIVQRDGSPSPETLVVPYFVTYSTYFSNTSDLFNNLCLPIKSASQTSRLHPLSYTGLSEPSDSGPQPGSEAGAAGSAPARAKWSKVHMATPNPAEVEIVQQPDGSYKEINLFEEYMKGGSVLETDRQQRRENILLTEAKRTESLQTKSGQSSGTGSAYTFRRLNSGYIEPYILPDAITGVIVIRDFGPNGSLADSQQWATDFVSAVQVLVSLNATRLILDVRDNPGGETYLGIDAVRYLMQRSNVRRNALQLVASPMAEAAVRARGKIFDNTTESPWYFGSWANMQYENFKSNDGFFYPTYERTFNGLKKTYSSTFRYGELNYVKWPDVPEQGVPYFEAQNILIFTNGNCYSTCSAFTHLLTRDFGIRSVALGGNPSYPSKGQKMSYSLGNNGFASSLNDVLGEVSDLNLPSGLAPANFLRKNTIFNFPLAMSFFSYNKYVPIEYIFRPATYRMMYRRSTNYLDMPALYAEVCHFF